MGASTQNAIWSFIHVFLWGNVTYYVFDISTCTRLKDSIHKKVLTCCEGLPVVDSRDHLKKWACKVTWETKCIILSTWRRPMITKLRKVVTYHDRPPFLKSHNHLITWPAKGHLTIWTNYISLSISSKNYCLAFNNLVALWNG